MRLLVVEDEKDLCDTIAKVLYDSGYEVDTCYDGGEALDYILTEEYDLIVLDLNLPGMDGMDILKELRQKNEETKVLILSARSQIADKVEGLDAGRTIIWKSRFICRNWKQESEVLPDESLYKKMSVCSVEIFVLIRANVRHMQKVNWYL